LKYGILFPEPIGNSIHPAGVPNTEVFVPTILVEIVPSDAGIGAVAAAVKPLPETNNPFASVVKRLLAVELTFTEPVKGDATVPSPVKSIVEELEEVIFTRSDKSTT
jgi:hypothetical protein